MNQIKICCLFFICLLFLIACEDTTKSNTTLYKATGTVTETKCTVTHKSMRLDNGVKYYGGNINCSIKKGTKLTLVHDKDFVVHELLVEGTEEIKTNEEDE